MGAVYFYHLTRAPLERTLPILLEKAMGAGWRCVVRGPDRALLERLDEALWASTKDGFLPHGLAGGPHDAEQPVLLSDGAETAACLMTVGGAAVSAEEIKAAKRTCILFDGHDAAAVQHARGQWKDLTGQGVEAQYWSEESGRWEKKAESAASA